MNKRNFKYCKKEDSLDQEDFEFEKEFKEFEEFEIFTKGTPSMIELM